MSVKPKLTQSQRAIFDALSDKFELPDTIGIRAGMGASNTWERTSRVCRILESKGLAERSRNRSGYIYWRKAETAT